MNPPKKQGFSICRTPKFLGEEGKNAQKSKEDRKTKKRAKRKKKKTALEGQGICHNTRHKTSRQFATCFRVVLFWQDGFFADFIFGPPDSFTDFVTGFFSSILWEKVPRKILQENPRQNPPKFIRQKSPTYFCIPFLPSPFGFRLVRDVLKPRCAKNAQNLPY